MARKTTTPKAVRPAKAPKVGPSHYTYLSAELAAATADDETREVEVVFYSGATVERYDPRSGGTLDLTLSMEEGAADLEALNLGGSVLDSHATWGGVGDILGAVKKESARLEDGVYKAVLRISKRAGLDDLWQDIKDGLVSNVSMGFDRLKLKETTKEGATRRTLFGVSWRPREVSFVAVGADGRAGTLSADLVWDDESLADDASEELTSAASAQKGKKMAKKKAVRAPRRAVVTEDAEDAESDELEMDAAEEITSDELEAQPTRAEIRAEERARAKEIRQRAEAVNLSNEDITELIDSDLSLAGATRKIFDKVRAGETESAPAGRATIVRDERADRIEMASELLLNRYDPAAWEETDRVKESGWFHWRMDRIGDEFARAAGFKVRTEADLCEFAYHSTSDFPAVLRNAAGKVLQRGYAELMATWTPLARRGNLSDFKQAHRPQLDGIPTLRPVGESGEIKHTTIKEAEEPIQLLEYAEIFTATRKLLANDDLGAFLRIPDEMGKSAKRLESDIVWGLINANGAMGDGVALFHASHGNLQSGALTEDNLGLLDKDIMSQRGLALQYIGLTTRFLIVPAALKLKGQRITTDTSPANSGDVNPFSGLQLIAEPRLDAGDPTHYYAAADPSQIDMIEAAYLSGSSGPILSQEDPFKVAGRAFRVQHDFGAAVLNWRGFAKSTG